MKTPLFDFQEEALDKLRDRLRQARAAATPDNPQAVAFSAPTGAGKTIVMTALFEQIFFGEHDLEAQPDAAILWVSDMPELNAQTRLKIEAMSSRIRARQLVTIDTNFDAGCLQGGHIYFINTQKLGKDKRLTGQSDIRQFPIWQTFTNTARSIPGRFYVVIDEAHRGMNRGQNTEQRAQSIMQRFILGSNEYGLCRIPLVLGISATPERFERLLSGTENTIHKVSVLSDKVRTSGLLKDRILIHYPESESEAHMALLAQAAREWQNLSAVWQAYCASQAESRVYPILVAQVEDGAGDRLTRTDLPAAIGTIEVAISRSLHKGEVVHTFNDRGDLDINGRKLRRVEASRIQEDKAIGVVFFKMSLSTGWDCPRAEVMMSFRHAEDHTYIAQLLGRMVRSPLARRVEADAALNDVHLYLPQYNRQAVDSVIEDLQNHEDVPPADTGTQRELVTLRRRASTEEIFAAMAELVTYRVDAVRKQSALRRFIKLGRRLTHDAIAEGAYCEAQRAAVGWLDRGVTDLKSRGLYESRVKSLIGISLRTVAFAHGAGQVEDRDPWAVEAAQADIERFFEQAGRLLGEGFHQIWWKANAERDASDVKLELIVLTGEREVMDRIEAQAKIAFDDLYRQYQRDFSSLPEKQRIRYEQLRLASAEPEALAWRLPNSIGAKRSDQAPVFKKHLYVEDNDRFRVDLGGWEAGVIAEELAKSEVVGWLRNVERQLWALQIPYEANGKMQAMYPDFLVIRKDSDGYQFDILEPHDGSRADNHWKAAGLARFADRHWHLFGRIQLIRQQRGSDGRHYFTRLDMIDGPTRAAVRAVQSNGQLNNLFVQFAHGD